MLTRNLFLFVACAFNLFSVGISLRLSRETILKPFLEGNALKIISGLNNFNLESVKNIAFAANQAGASHIDISCRTDVVKAALSVCSLPICVSSVNPEEFVTAVEAGADMVEIGNFDSFYDQGIQFSAEDVLLMTKKTRSILPNIVLSVTIPHALRLDEQIELARRLEECGADIIQTEGKMGVITSNMGVQEMIQKAAPTIASAYALSRAVSIPVMCASGLSEITAPIALAVGAKGVGIGSMISKLSTRQEMLMAVSVLADSIGRAKGSDNANLKDMAFKSLESISVPSIKNVE